MAGERFGPARTSVELSGRARVNLSFGKVLSYNPQIPLNNQIPADIELVHLQFEPAVRIDKPYLITHHGNFHPKPQFDINTVFVSRNHAERNGAVCYVHNGLDPEEYGPVDWNRKREHLLFLGYAKRPEKNLRDASYLARRTKNRLVIIGGQDKWFKRRPWLRYQGFIGGEGKHALLNSSKALLFPVRWPEPFGLAIIESLYFGGPVIGSCHGSLPELINADVGFLSNHLPELLAAVFDVGRFNPRRCHEYVMERFTVRQMTEQYLSLYTKVLSGQSLNPQPPVNGGNFDRKQLLPIYRAPFIS